MTAQRFYIFVQLNGATIREAITSSDSAENALYESGFLSRAVKAFTCNNNLRHAHWTNPEGSLVIVSQAA